MKREILTIGLFIGPTLPCGFLRNFLALGRRKGVSAGATALQPAFAAKGHGGGVFGGIVRNGSGPVLDLAGEDIADQLAKLDGITRAL